MQGPYLEIDWVRQALEAMRQGEELGPMHPLARFASIQRPYRAGASLGGSAGSDTAVFAALSRAIRHRLDHQRRMYGLPPVSALQGVQALEEDFSHDNEELEAWSLLYHRYIRTDLSLSVDQIHSHVQSVAPQSRRNLHRRQSLGLHRLTHYLAQREISARLKDRQAYLRSRLPLQGRTAPYLVGRDHLLQSVLDRLNDATTPRHVLIYGPPGIGKRTLARAVAHRLVDSNSLQNLAWIERPDQYGDGLPNQIPLELGLAENAPPLRVYLQMVDTLIILDRAQGLVDNPDLLASMSALLGAARLLICAERLPATYAVGVDLARIPIPELDRDSAERLLEHYASRLGKYGTLQQGELSHLVSELGRNPGSLITALSAGPRFSKIRQSEEVYRAAWESSPAFPRLVWLLLALVQGGATLHRILYVMLAEGGPEDVDAALDELRQNQVIDGSPANAATLTPLARALADKVMQEPDNRELVEDAFQRVATFYVNNDDVLGCLHPLDRAFNLALPPDLIFSLAGLCAPVIERGGAWAAWSASLERLADLLTGEQRRWIALHLGIALRWQAQWKAAGYWLAAVIGEAGQAGDFLMQADAMTELGTLARLQGHYDIALGLLSRAQDTYQRRRYSRGLERTYAERIQIALDTGDLPGAAGLLNAIESWSPRLQNLAAQVALRNGEPDVALIYAQEAQSALGGNMPMWARNAALLGQIHANLGNWSDAIDHLASALVVMEQTDDLLGHARARLNLSTVYINVGNVGAALRCLRGLPADLELLGDVDSLHIAIENLAKLPQDLPGKGKASD